MNIRSISAVILSLVVLTLHFGIKTSHAPLGSPNLAFAENRLDSGTVKMLREYGYTHTNQQIEDSVNRLLKYLPDVWRIPGISIVDGVCGGNSPACAGIKIYFEEDYLDKINTDPTLLHELTHINLRDRWDVDCRVTEYGQTDDWEYTAEAVTRYVYGAVNFRRLIIEEAYRNKYPSIYGNSTCYADLYSDIHDIFGREFYYESYNNRASTLGYYTDTRKNWVSNLVNRLYQKRAAEIMGWKLK